MHKRRLNLLFLGFLFVCLAMITNAQATRTWVSGVGDDANPCSRTAPCKTFAGAISKTAASGEINCLDPAGYGAVTITKSMTINCTGTLGGILAAGTNGINVNSGTAVVSLRGLDINGAGTGLCGIKIIAAARVYVENTVIDGFTQAGIWIENAGDTQVLIKNATVKNNVGDGVYSVPKGSSDIFVVDSLLSGNGNGIRAEANATVRVSGSSIIFNGSGFSSKSEARIVSLQNNIVDGNGKNGTPTKTIILQ